MPATDILWVEDPILRNDFEGPEAAPLRCSLDASQLRRVSRRAGKRQLMLAGATDMLNVHGQVTDVMRIGWLAAELGSR
jgi:hypothetical protein